ncbi:MAG: hypothetical protein INR71_14925, partial [Terriglobus roseus]|nr:hypothetical protein [Terriglobus roseus]
MQESYITHIRIREDADYPQSPPPPDSNPSSKKDRVIVVAVKNTGRVRMHKGRENANGTFSIGKTWNLEDLTIIESYTNSHPQQVDEYQRKEWAGDTGFTCTIVKPYFWAAGSSKEKDFFIASLVKIYRKYTNGKVPEMLGFSPRELEPILGGPAPQQPSRPTPESSRQTPFSPPPPHASSTSLNGNRSMSPQPPPSATFPPRPTPPGPRTVASQENLYARQRSPSAQGRTPPVPGSAKFPPEPPQPPQVSQPPRQLRTQPSQERGLRQPPSRDQMRVLNMPTQPSSTATSQRNLTPQSSRSETTHEHSESVESSSLESRSPRRQALYQMEHGAPIDGLGISSGSPAMSSPPPPTSAPADRWKTNGAVAAMARDRREPSPMRQHAQVNAVSMPDAPAIPDSPPERRRPPMLNQHRGSHDEAPMPAPLASPRFGGSNRSSNRGQQSTDSFDVMSSIPGGYGASPPPEPMDDDEAPIPAPLQIHSVNRRDGPP